MKEWTLCVQGGGFRGAYSGGALERLMDESLYSNEVYGTSAGALVAADYASKDKDRTLNVMLDGMRSKDFVKLHNYVRKGSLFDFDWFFGAEMENRPFNLDGFKKSETRYYAVAVSLTDARPAYFTNDDPDIYLGMAASSSLPSLSKKPVFIRGLPYLDGGVVESVPFHKALEDGKERIVVLATREKGYRKKTKRDLVGKNIDQAVRRHFKDYPKFLEAYARQNEIYNEQMDEMDSLAEEGRILVLYPRVPPDIGVSEKNEKKVTDLFQAGYDDCGLFLERLRNYIQ
jgi:predicted patatin/cPLA2 family phospholipase